MRPGGAATGGDAFTESQDSFDNVASTAAATLEVQAPR